MTTIDITQDPVSLAKALCDVPSESGKEQALADALDAALRTQPHLRIFRDGNAIIARTEWGNPRRVIVAGHLDTVPIKDNVPSWFDEREDGRWLVGRGAVDMKAGVAVQLAAAVRLTRPRYDVTWVFYDNEEVASHLNGMGRLAGRYPELFHADFGILCEPTAGRVEGGCNGTTRFWVRASGVRAHSARSWVGDNAIHKLEPALHALNTFQPETVEVDGLAYREGLNAVLIDGGVAGNVIPDAVQMMVNYRFAPSRTEDEVRARMAELFAGYELEFVDMSPGARPGLDRPEAQEFLRAVGGEALPKYGWTDVARLSSLGIPAVNYGPGDALLAHADDEALPVTQITECAEGLISWLSPAEGEGASL